MSWIDSKVDYQRHVRLSTTVDSIEAAFAFVLNAIDDEAIQLPVITIEPTMTYADDDSDGVIRYDVAVAGHANRRDEGARPVPPNVA